jgi:hypothetical protein
MAGLCPARPSNPGFFHRKGQWTDLLLVAEAGFIFDLASDSCKFPDSCGQNK